MSHAPKVIPLPKRPQPQSVGTIRHQGQWVLLANGKPVLTVPSFAEALAAIQELPL